MATTFGKVLKTLRNIGKFEVTDFRMSEKKDSIHRLLHRYKEELIVPYVAISDNITFCLNEGKKQVITADNVKCDVIEWKEIHICELESDIKRLYGISAWDFIKKWYNMDKNMSTMHFIRMKIKKID